MQREIGSASRAGYLALVNHGNFLVPSPAPGTVLRIPYLLRYVVLDDQPLFEIARQFYGDRSATLAFSRTSSSAPWNGPRRVRRFNAIRTVICRNQPATAAGSRS